MQTASPANRSSDVEESSMRRSKRVSPPKTHYSPGKAAPVPHEEYVEKARRHKRRKVLVVEEDQNLLNEIQPVVKHLKKGKENVTKGDKNEEKDIGNGEVTRGRYLSKEMIESFTGEIERVGVEDPVSYRIAEETAIVQQLAAKIRELPSNPSKEELENLLSGVDWIGLRYAEILIGGGHWVADELWIYLLVNKYNKQIDDNHHFDQHPLCTSGLFLYNTTENIADTEKSSNDDNDSVEKPMKSRAKEIPPPPTPKKEQHECILENNEHQEVGLENLNAVLPPEDKASTSKTKKPRKPRAKKVPPPSTEENDRIQQSENNKQENNELNSNNTEFIHRETLDECERLMEVEKIKDTEAYKKAKENVVAVYIAKRVMGLPANPPKEELDCVLYKATPEDLREAEIFLTGGKMIFFELWYHMLERKFDYKPDRYSATIDPYKVYNALETGNIPFEETPSASDDITEELPPNMDSNKSIKEQATRKRKKANKDKQIEEKKESEDNKEIKLEKLVASINELPAEPRNEEIETLLSGVNASELKAAEELVGVRPCMDALWRFLIAREFVMPYKEYATDASPHDVYMALDKMTSMRNRRDVNRIQVPIPAIYFDN